MVFNVGADRGAAPFARTLAGGAAFAMGPVFWAA